MKQLFLGLGHLFAIISCAWLLPWSETVSWDLLVEGKTPVGFGGARRGFPLGR